MKTHAVSLIFQSSIFDIVSGILQLLDSGYISIKLKYTFFFFLNTVLS